MSVRLSAWNNSAPTGQIFMKFDIWVFFENMSRKFKLNQNLRRVRGTLHEDQYTFFIYLARFFLEWEMFQTKIVEIDKRYQLDETTVIYDQKLSLHVSGIYMPIFRSTRMLLHVVFSTRCCGCGSIHDARSYIHQKLQRKSKYTFCVQ
jgi:hypothetical protein